MRRTMSILALPVIVLALITDATADTPVEDGEYGQYQTYDPQPATVATPPAGAVPIYLQNIGRHGSRASTSSHDINEAISIFNAAEDAGAVEPAAVGFGDDARALRTAMSTLGYGELSELGEEQWRNIGRRTAEAYPEFFTYATASNGKVDFVGSSSQRAKDSATRFFYGLEDVRGDTFNNTPRETNDSLLRLSGSYDANEADQVDQLRDSKGVEARNLLRELFEDPYVYDMSHATQIETAHDLWDAYSVAPSMSGEDAPSLNKYISNSVAAEFAELNDGEAFYRYGPGLVDTNGYANAVVVRDSFFNEVDDVVHGSDTDIATFRFSHGETLMPFIALLDLPGSDEQETRGGAPGYYTHDTNDWRGEVHGKMAVNVEMAVYRRLDGKVVATFRLNEQPVALDATNRGTTHCKDVAETSTPFFYDYEKLKTCIPRS